jgi:hypothetical protein
MSIYQKTEIDEPRAAFAPQRAFVPPGTVYRFAPEKVSELTQSLPPPTQSTDTANATLPRHQLLPLSGGNWLTTLQTLNYGLLLWSSAS